MEYEEGYTKLLTYRQGMEIYQKTKRFTTNYLDKFRDSRLIGHMNDSARSISANICEGAKRRNTKAYLEFLGFSRASLEELKGDYTELKRELIEGERWVNKDKEGLIGINKDREGLRSNNKDKEGLRSNNKDREGLRSNKKDREGLMRNNNEREGVVGIEKEIEGLLDLIYGQDCMMGRQIAALEKKAIDDKALPQNELIKRGWKSAKSADKRFWQIAKERFGIERDEKGLIRIKKEKEG